MDLYSELGLPDDTATVDQSAFVNAGAVPVDSPIPSIPVGANITGISIADAPMFTQGAIDVEVADGEGGMTLAQLAAQGGVSAAPPPPTLTPLDLSSGIVKSAQNLLTAASVPTAQTGTQSASSIAAATPQAIVTQAAAAKAAANKKAEIIIGVLVVVGLILCA